MLSQRDISVRDVDPRRMILQSNVRTVAPRLRAFAASAVWWLLSLGMLAAIWELAAALQLINTVILPPPHAFVAELRNQAQFLMPQVGAEPVGSHFIALTAIWASLRRVLIGLVLAFVCAVTLGSLAFYFNIFGKLTLPTVTLLAPLPRSPGSRWPSSPLGLATGPRFLWCSSAWSSR